MFVRRNLPPIESYYSDHYCGYNSNFETKILEILGSFAVRVCLCEKEQKATMNTCCKPKNLYSVNDKPFLNSIADTHHIY
jgi:hypothetical protein